MGIAALCGAALAGLMSLSPLQGDGAVEAVGAVTMALLLCGATGVVLQCAAGVRMGGTFGIAVSPSAVRAAGVRLLTAETLTLRRGCLAEVRVTRRFADRVNGLCSVDLIPKGCRHGIQCHCMPYDRVQALLERFG